MTTSELLPYPIPNDSALVPPAEWEALREELQRVEGLAVGGLRAVPVRW